MMQDNVSGGHDEALGLVSDEVRKTTLVDGLTLVSGGGEFEPPAAGPEKYRVDMLGPGERTWASNGIEYDTPEDAEAAGRDLFGRWLTAADWRAVPVSTPRNETYVPGSGR